MSGWHIKNVCLPAWQRRCSSSLTFFSSALFSFLNCWVFLTSVSFSLCILLTSFSFSLCMCWILLFSFALSRCNCSIALSSPDPFVILFPCVSFHWLISSFSLSSKDSFLSLSWSLLGPSFFTSAALVVWFDSGIVICVSVCAFFSTTSSSPVL